MRAVPTIIQHVFHVLNNTFPKGMCFKFAEIGIPQPHSLHVFSCASRFRAAVKTITGWRENLHRLNAARTNDASGNWFTGRAHSNPWWDTPPAVDYINEAFNSSNCNFGNLHKQTETIMLVDYKLLSQV